MVCGQHVGLGAEVVLGVAHVRLQVGGHLVAGGEQAGEDLAPGVGQSVLAVDLVEGHLAVVRIDDHLDGVPHVVDAVAVRLRVGETVGGCVSVPHPYERPIVT